MSRLQSAIPSGRNARLLGALMAALLLIVALGAACARPAPNTAHVVIQFADGQTHLRTISWSGELTRVQALELAGYAVASDAAGEAICSIAGQGCPAQDCFCPANLWAQGQWDGEGWNGEAWPPPPVQAGDLIAFRLGGHPDYSDWGLAGHLADASGYLAADRALEWLRSQQGPDGGYDDGLNPVGAAVRSLLALGAAGYEPAAWGSPSLDAYLTQSAASDVVAYAESSAAASGKLAVAVAWAGQNPASYAGLDLPALIAGTFDAATGAYGGGSGDTAWAVLGLYAAGQPIPQRVVAFFEGSQLGDGGWAWNEMQPQGEVQHTAVVIQALLAAGAPRDGDAIARAMAFVRQTANPDGGYPYQAPGESDLGSTAAVIQALLSVGAVGDDAEALAAAQRYLQSQQDADGSLRAWSPLYATQECLPALMGRTFGPLAGGQ